MHHAQYPALDVHLAKKKLLKKKASQFCHINSNIAHQSNNMNHTKNENDYDKNLSHSNDGDDDENSNTNSDSNVVVVDMNIVPPGFRFHPTDEELISFYLARKVMAVDTAATLTSTDSTSPLDVINFDLDRVIPEVDLNKLEPWDLYEKCKVSGSHHSMATATTTTTTEWYFFSLKDKKYPTGTRTNRATAAGFWKATGRDKAVRSADSRRSIGMRKTLVFYRGRAPHGTKTDWIMHEYRLDDKDYEPKCNEDGWVVCRVFKKRTLPDKEATHSNSNMSDEETPNYIPLGKRCKKDNDEMETPTIAHLPCKLEVVEDFPSLQPNFLQLPQLQSSEITSVPSNPSENNYRHTLDQPPSLCSESGDIDPEECHDNNKSNKPFFMSDHELVEFIYNGHFPYGWSMYDTMARYNPELCSLPADAPQTLYFGKMQPPPIEYASNCDVNLWNFTK